ncbi:DUF3224 domain-containing protein [Nonomuraea sp. SYSU D8015]|uniref:DUF3224 domain-containing protein n=1 Tax=Nonomuraea sp. SYSU D8015 TaxID=2593644 RepID=UPI0016605854|nr:DUF3224 domain-containing protein [Nonomuraea sp. SYSU D8015]
MSLRWLALIGASVVALGLLPAGSVAAASAPAESSTYVKGTVDLLGQTVEEIGPPDKSGFKLLNTVFNTRFSGGLVGNGYHVYVEIFRPDGSATSTGTARFVGKLEGRSGTFVMESSGTSDPNGAINADWCVVKGSATGGLAGLSGCGKVTTTGDPVAYYTLEYTLPIR